MLRKKFRGSRLPYKSAGRKHPLEKLKFQDITQPQQGYFLASVRTSESTPQDSTKSITDTFENFRSKKVLKNLFEVNPP